MTGPVEARAFTAMDRRLDAGSTAPLTVAVSGGGDSVALLELAAAWSRRLGRSLRVLHVDHGLHPDSVVWADRVQEHAARLRLDCDLLAWTGPKPAGGLPAAARAARHALMAEAARAAGARVILLGHTADDVREGEQMRREGGGLGRVRTWSPSPAWPEGRGLMLLRPLLSVSRAELRAWLVERRLAWIEDPANADLRFARARARAAPEATVPADLPLPQIGADLVADAGWGLLRVGRAALAELPPAAAARLLSAALVCAGGGVRPPRGEAVRRLAALLSGPGAATATLAGARVAGEGDELVFGREPGRTAPPALQARPGLVWDGRVELASGEGRVVPLKGRLSRLRASDARALQAVPAPFRPTLPVLESEGRLELPAGRWLPHARLRAALGDVRREADLP
jgi:tRNA(Ile)-lysidine synthase